MNYLLIVTSLSVICLTAGLPVSPPKKEEQKKENHHDPDDPRQNPEVTINWNDLEYKHYLQEIVSVLESDPQFREKLDKASEVDIRTGKIAQELEYVAHHVRSKLDEIKRTEIERLRHLAIKQYELSNDIDRKHIKISEHLDHSNQHTFEIEDLKKLILKTSEDLAAADKLRREEFKQYEMQKEFEKQEHLKTLNEEHRKQYELELKRQQEKHNNHEKVHHPGGKAQLEEVWEKQDHMEGQEFNPRTFFMMHDLDGNGVWDELEVKALFVKELDKVYQSGIPEDDMRERAEEMERMREHVFREADANNDSLISFKEFMEQTKRAEFQRDPNWETVDNVPQFSHDEYLEFEKKRRDEIDRLIAQGVLPPHPNMPHGYYPGPQGPYQVHPNEIPHSNQYPSQGYPSNQGHPNQMPPQHYQQQGHPQQPHYQSQQYPSQGQPPQVQAQQGHPQQHGYPQQNNPPQGYPSQGHHPPPQQYQPHPNQQPYNPSNNSPQFQQQQQNQPPQQQQNQLSQQQQNQPSQQQQNQPPQQQQNQSPQQQQNQPPQQQQNQPPQQQQNQPPHQQQNQPPQQQQNQPSQQNQNQQPPAAPQQVNLNQNQVYEQVPKQNQPPQGHQQSNNPNH